MPFANVNQRTPNFTERPNFVGDRNTFDLSYDYKTTFTMGKLIPFLLLETLPGDIFHIRNEYMFRFAPLYLPIMHRVNFNADFFYVPNRIVWRNTYEDCWEKFITNPDSGLEHPVVEVDVPTSADDPTGELVYYMGFPQPLQFTAIISTYPINAIPIWAYYLIWDEWYRNDQIQERILESGVVGMLTQGTNTWPGIAQFCQYVNWNRDYYTSATITPQLGDAVLIPSSEEGFPKLPTVWKDITDGTTPGSAGNLQIEADGDTYLDDGVGTIYLYHEHNATVKQFREAAMLQEWLERSLRAGDRYADQMVAFWRVNPMAGIIDRPVYFGNEKGRVNITDVMTTATTHNDVNSTDFFTGEYAGKAMMLESTKGVKTIEVLEHGFILGLISVTPESSYMQGIEKLWLRRDIYDYAWQQFALIGDQPITGAEVDFTYVAANQSNNDRTFGYIPMYSEYRWHNDIYTGAMRNTWISFHMGRELDYTGTTDLDSDFVSTRQFIGEIVQRVFRVTEGEDEIFAHIYNDVLVERKLPMFGIPAL